MTTLDDSWPSTKALSVYNALSLSGCDMTPDEILGFLRQAFDPEVSPEYVTDGLRFLAARGWVRSGEKISIERNKNRRGRRVVRVNNDRDLAMLDCWVRT